MAVDFTNKIYVMTQDLFSVPCTFTPQAGAAYGARGIFATRAMDVVAEDGSIFSDQQTIFDIREAEFTTLPAQGDKVNIPVDCNGAPLGDYEILDADTNGGGETTLVLRKLLAAKP